MSARQSEAVLRRLIQLAAPVPALVVGALVMRNHGVAPAQWGLNLAVGAAALLVCAAVRERPPDAERGRHPIPLALVGLALLAMTFVDVGITGVHRWVQLGPVSLYAGPVALPMVIIAAGAMLRASGTHTGWGMFLAVMTAGILTVQPDAAQASGLAVAVIVLTLGALARERVPWIGAALVIALAGWSWFRNDPLAPVPHVEGILGLAREAGVPWLAASIASLALLPVPFFLRRANEDAATIRALGAYVAVCILVPLVRNYPFPLLGFGVSPIIGYAIALAAVRRS